MTVFDFLKNLQVLPFDNANKRNRPSHSALFRWIQNGSVIINGKQIKPYDEVVFPITELIFFPKGHKITMF